jgi:tRNA-specific 2-thiouridylase
MVDNITDMYSNKALSSTAINHFTNPRNVGVVSNYNGHGRAGNLKNCGDTIDIYLKVLKGEIKEISFQAQGCPASIASASATTTLAKNKSLDEATLIDASQIEKLLGGLPENKRTCSNLGSLALQRAIEDYISHHLKTVAIPKKSNRVAVAMSGGVDSSLAAAMLVEQGYQVIGITMRLYDQSIGNRFQPNTKKSSNCCSVSDINDARQVAIQLNIPHYVADFRSQFKSKVIEVFCQQYLKGKTPNPCIDCNREIKFTIFRQLAGHLGANYIATGHYVNIIRDRYTNQYLVKKAVDTSKDQSYMFWDASQEVLSTLLTPLGKQTKSQTRCRARELKLAVASKNESQDICFVPDGDYVSFLAQNLKYTPKPGPILDFSGRIIGTHKGIHNYTVGQRRKLGISNSEPLYVFKVNSVDNSLVVGNRHQVSINHLIAGKINFIAFNELEKPTDFQVKYRYNMEPVAATITSLGKNKVKVSFAKPVMAAAPGQSIVFYQGDILVGGGIIL